MSFLYVVDILRLLNSTKTYQFVTFSNVSLKNYMTFAGGGV